MSWKGGGRKGGEEIRKEGGRENGRDDGKEKCLAEKGFLPTSAPNPALG